jgi:hypothetical protein
MGWLKGEVQKLPVYIYQNLNSEPANALLIGKDTTAFLADV